MQALNDSMFSSILNIDAMLNNETLGTIVNEDDKFYLYDEDAENKLFLLTEKNSIRVVNRREYHEIDYKDLFKTYGSGYFFSGYKALVGDKNEN